MEAMVAQPREGHRSPDCGHWTQQEKPDEVNRVLIDWLGRKIV